MSELDLTDPEHVAELLRAALPGFEDHQPKTVELHLDALCRSVNPVFDNIGVGERVEPDAPAEPEPWEQGPALEPEPDAELPLDLGGVGQALEQPAQTPEYAGPRPAVYARRGWTEGDRQRAKGQHEVYLLRAEHTRSEPIRAAFTGRCQAVRVTLPRQEPPADAFIGTWVGTVEARDHLAFSIEEIEQRYARAFGRERRLRRVDLITGARFRGRRFSPISVYLGYVDGDAKPDFYFLESGSAAGRPQVMYCARSLDQVINAKSGFRFTPFACGNNWYEGGLELSRDGREPACVYLSVAQTKTGEHGYLRLSVHYERERELRRVIHPFELQIEAAMRVLALAEESGCKLERGEGAALEHSLGPLARILMPWDERPTGKPLASELRRYCGCPK